MANAFSGNKGKVEIVAGTVYQSLTSPTKPTDVIPSGAAGIVADSNGLLQVVAGDGTVSPLGEQLFSATAASTLTAGQWVYINSSGNADKAKADSTSTCPAVGVVNVGAASSAACLIQTAGIFNTTGLTKGSFYWLSASTAGAITSTIPSSSGQNIDPIGYALSATQLLIGAAQPALPVIITPTATGGIASSVSGFTTCWTGGVGISLATSGNDTANTNGDIYWAPIFVPCNTTITGIAFLIGSVGGTDKAISGLYSSAGALLASSALAGTTVGTAANFQNLDFTAPYAAVGPALYYVALQFNGTTAKWRSHTAPGLKFVTGTQAGTFGTMASITPGSTYTANKGPIAVTY